MGTRPNGLNCRETERDTLVLQRHKIRLPRIVVVDDEDACLQVFEIIIRNWSEGATRLLFSTSEEAWQELARQDPDLLILDMPLIGLEILPLLAERKVEYPILLTTGLYTVEEMRQQADPNLKISLLPKPFSIDDLLRELFVHIGPCDCSTKLGWVASPCMQYAT